MKTGTVFAPTKYGKNAWKRLVDNTSVVHEGRELRRVVYGGKADRTGLFRLRCDKTVTLVTLTSATLNCFACLVLKNR